MVIRKLKETYTCTIYYIPAFLLTINVVLKKQRIKYCSFKAMYSALQVSSTIDEIVLSPIQN